MGSYSFLPGRYYVNIVFQMVQETLLTEKKKRGPKPTGKGKVIGVRLQPKLLSAIDSWRKKENVEKRPEAIRQILTDHLIAAGIMPLKEGD